MAGKNPVYLLQLIEHDRLIKPRQKARRGTSESPSEGTCEREEGGSTEDDDLC